MMDRGEIKKTPSTFSEKLQGKGWQGNFIWGRLEDRIRVHAFSNDRSNGVIVYPGRQSEIGCFLFEKEVEGEHEKIMQPFRTVTINPQAQTEVDMFILHEDSSISMFVPSRAGRGRSMDLATTDRLLILSKDTRNYVSNELLQEMVTNEKLLAAPLEQQIIEISEMSRGDRSTERYFSALLTFGEDIQQIETTSDIRKVGFVTILPEKGAENYTEQFTITMQECTLMNDMITRNGNGMAHNTGETWFEEVRILDSIVTKIIDIEHEMDMVIYLPEDEQDSRRTKLEDNLRDYNQDLQNNYNLHISNYELNPVTGEFILRVSIPRVDVFFTGLQALHVSSKKRVMDL